MLERRAQNTFKVQKNGDRANFREETKAWD
jgi:hypothetical protein